MDTAVRVDLSALYEGIQDVLVELNVITDDNYTIVASHDGSGVFIDRENPRMEIEITAKEDNSLVHHSGGKSYKVEPIQNKEVF